MPRGGNRQDFVNNPTGRDIARITAWRRSLTPRQRKKHREMILAKRAKKKALEAVNLSFSPSNGT
jgi:hypothetical protein